MTYPKLIIEEVRKVFDNGLHDAFTDMIRFQDRFYLTFRSCPDGHGVFASSSVVVLSSVDGIAWREAFSFSVPGRDTRDPHFLAFHDRLFVYTGCWLVPPPGLSRDLNDHLGYCALSDDGLRWRGPLPLEGTYGHYIWRAAAWKDKAYLCARRRREFVAAKEGGSDPELIQAAMLESDDGLVWRFTSFFAESHGDETAFIFENDGSILALLRGPGAMPARIRRSAPPYREWTEERLDRNVGGPLLAKWTTRYLAGGRRTTDPDEPRTTLYWLVDDRLEEAAELPSSGDNSYPGFVALDSSHALVSYYSSHEARSPNSSAIFIARVALG